MGSLSSIANEQKTVDAIYEYWKKRGEAEGVRRYMGGSSIGLECDRWLWYLFRIGASEEFSGRMMRLFDRGHREELVFVEELRGIGATVHEVGEDGQQFGVSAYGGHLAGHMDGVALGVLEAPKTWHLLEFKTHNAKSFASLVRDGVQKSKPQHYAQMQMYMGLSKLTRALYLAVNKDNDELYQERVRFDPRFFKSLMERAKRIIETSEAPPCAFPRADHFGCQFCPFKNLCWGLSEFVLPIKPELVTQRLSIHATADTENGGWLNAQTGKHYTDKELNSAPEKMVILPSLFFGCKAVDAGEDNGGWIDYETSDGRRFRQGGDGYTWLELTKTRWTELGGKAPAEESVPDFVLEVPAILLEAYPHEDSERLWDGPESDLTEAYKRLVPGDAKCVKVEDNDKTLAAEYEGGFLCVVYKADKYAAIWRGKE